jgi:succinoglycan biosynthesis protein ExoM
MPEKHHISVCICTFRRPRLLAALLRALDGQETGGLFEHAIVVVDNDKAESARTTVESLSGRMKTEVRYFVEPEQNIAMARNRAVANSHGDFIAFIDDDEHPGPRWLLEHFGALSLFETSGVLGPVLPRYESTPPRWVLDGRFFERPTYFSGYFLHWELTRTGNCLLRRSVFAGNGPWFRPQFGRGGEDRDFFKRKIAEGHVFVWCDEAPLYESVPPDRWSIKVMLKRALLRGKMTYSSRRHRPGNTLASAGIAFYYSLCLPLLFVLFPVFGFDTFMKYLIKDFDHIGKLFALFGIDPVKERYVV